MNISREAAARLLAKLDREMLAGEVLRQSLERDSDWIAPATAERLQRIAAAETYLRSLLVARAGARRENAGFYEHPDL